MDLDKDSTRRGGRRVPAERRDTAGAGGRGGPGRGGPAGGGVGRVAVCAVVAMIVAGTAAVAAAQTVPRSQPPALRLGVPAYWAATTTEGARAFRRLIAAAGTTGTGAGTGPGAGADAGTSIVDKVVVNGPASGPADPFDPALARAVRRLSDSGVTVLGYVDTGYLGRTGATTTRVNRGSTAVADWQAQAAADAGMWHALYAGHGLGGVFFDQTLPTCGEGRQHVEAYGELSGAVRDLQRDAVVAINPGIAVEECYTEVADTIVLAEDTFTAYRNWTPPDWVADHPASRFWHLVHGAATPDQMREAVTLARRRNAGTVYVTDAVIDPVGGPWNALPARAYWTAQLAAVRARATEACPRADRPA